MFIGESLNDCQVAALQAVSDACGGARFAQVTSVKKCSEETRLCTAIRDISLRELNTLLDELEKEFLIERKDIKGEPYVGLTEDGERCNRIEVY